MAERKPMRAALTKTKTHVLMVKNEWRFRATLAEFDRLVALYKRFADPAKCRFHREYTEDSATLNRLAKEIEGLPR